MGKIENGEIFHQPHRECWRADENQSHMDGAEKERKKDDQFEIDRLQANRSQFAEIDR